MPKPVLPPPRDPKLGTAERPGRSCIDIKKWGPENAKDGIFYVKNQLGVVEVFCDMGKKTEGQKGNKDEGGWTLMLNYIHHPGESLSLHEYRFPKDIKDNSHIYLNDAGYTREDVKQLRFFCNESVNGIYKYWNFQSSNRQMIDVALFGEQSRLTPTSLQDSYREETPIPEITAVYKNGVDRSLINQYNAVGESITAGFTETVFGSDTFKSYWTIKGSSSANEGGEVQDIYECASYHRGDTVDADQNSPANVMSHHSIWFKGSPMSTQAAKTRYLSWTQDEINKLANQ